MSNLEITIPGPESVRCPMRRYHGLTISEIARNDPAYLRWARDTTDWGATNAAGIDEALQVTQAHEQNDGKTLSSDPAENRVERAIAASKRTTCPLKKFRGYTIFEIAEMEPDYLSWARTGSDWGEENRDLIQAAFIGVAREKIIDVPVVELTEHQKKMVRKLELGHQIGYRILKLMGGAGYGKSYATNALARYFIEKAFRVHACAVSYVATEVLRQQLDPLGVSCATVARTLKFTKKWENGKEVYDHSYDTPEAAREILTGRNVLIVDECSMIADRDADLLFRTVFEAPSEEKGVLILVGDQNQLPPVKQDTPSLCCTFSDPSEVMTAELTEPMRYSRDSHLYAVEQMARDKPGALFDHAEAIASQRSSQVTEVGSLEDLVESYVTNMEYDPVANHRALLFRRSDVTDINNRIRYRLFGENARIVEEAEKLMILSTTDYPYREPDPDKKIADTVRYYSGTSFRVDEVDTAGYRIVIGENAFEIPHYRVRFTGLSDWVSIIFGVSESQADRTKTGSTEYEAALKAALEYGRAKDAFGNRTGSWKPLIRLKGDFVLVAYTYATSVHRCQGQTLDYCYAAPRSLLGVPPPMGPALAYVALTRAKKHLTIVR